MKIKKMPISFDVATLQPDEINALRQVVNEYCNRKQNITNEIQGLKEDLKTLDEEFAEKLDIKTLKQAEKLFSLLNLVTKKDTFDLFVEALSDVELNYSDMPVDE